MTDSRTRRSSAEVRELMLAAARKLFHDCGFEATSTRDIASEAGVSESMIFRHFGSKQAAYEQAVLDPFVQFVQSFVTEWTRPAATFRDPDQLAHSYVSGFYELCRDHLELIAVLSAARKDRSGTVPGRVARLVIREQLDALVAQLVRHHAESGSEPGMDPQLSVRFAIAIVVGAAQLGDDFFDAGEQLMPELAAFVVRGAGRHCTQPPAAHGEAEGKQRDPLI